MWLVPTASCGNRWRLKRKTGRTKPHQNLLRKLATPRPKEWDSLPENKNHICTHSHYLLLVCLFGTHQFTSTKQAKPNAHTPTHIHAHITHTYTRCLVYVFSCLVFVCFFVCFFFWFSLGRRFKKRVFSRESTINMQLSPNTVLSRVNCSSSLSLSLRSRRARGR